MLDRRSLHLWEYRLDGITRPASSLRIWLIWDGPTLLHLSTPKARIGSVSRPEISQSGILYTVSSRHYLVATGGYDA